MPSLAGWVAPSDPKCYRDKNLVCQFSCISNLHHEYVGGSKTNKPPCVVKQNTLRWVRTLLLFTINLRYASCTHLRSTFNPKVNSSSSSSPMIPISFKQNCGQSQHSGRSRKDPVTLIYIVVKHLRCNASLLKSSEWLDTKSDAQHPLQVYKTKSWFHLNAVHLLAHQSVTRHRFKWLLRKDY